MKTLYTITAVFVVGILSSPVSQADAGATAARSSISGALNARGGVRALEARLAALEAELTHARLQIANLHVALDAEIRARQAANRRTRGQLGRRLSRLEETLTCVDYDDIGRSLLIVGCNVHVRDGSGLTAGTTGLGNLIIGYNADHSGALNRYGSHNVIIGDGQAYTSSANLLAPTLASSHDLSLLVGGNLTEVVSSNRNTSIGNDASIDVGRDRTTTVGRDLSTSSAGNTTATSARAIELAGNEEVALTSGNARQVLSRNGDIELDGKDVNVKASGTLSLKAGRIIQN